jgi:sister-chromatid-cohesion protein PDS5
LSDLACLLIDNKCKESSWPLVAYEGHVSLQSKLYRTLPSGTIQTETIKKSYLPNELIQQIEQEHNHKAGEKRSRSHVTTGNKRVKVEVK